jgi:ATP-binding cassette, subfamily F, member 3
MLTVQNISKSYGGETVLKEISFSLNPSERIGLVGPNGCGKTTLLRILIQQETPDSGSFYLKPSLAIGYMPQGLELKADETMGNFLEQAGAGPSELAYQLESLAVALTNNPGQADIQQAYDQALARLETASESSGRRAEVLAGLGLDHFSPETPVSNLSGGQKTRLSLARVLLTGPQLLLLDEPTNHLDLDMLAWLEGWLQRFRGAALIVSHDRAFLDAIATGILEIDPRSHTARLFLGNYTDYLEAKQMELERHWQEYQDQRQEIVRLQEAADHLRRTARFRRGGKADTPDKFAKGFFGNRARGTVARAKHIERRLEHLLTDERIEKPQQSWQLKLDFGATPASGHAALSLHNLAIGYGKLILLQELNLHVWQGARLALIGPNGAGKTTLLRTITGLLPPLAGEVRIGANIRLGYMAQEQETLDPKLDAYTSIRKLAPFSETDARAFLHQYLFSGDDVFIPAGRLSYGERARLLLACLVAQGCNLLLLDEPINHLDIPSRVRFEQALANFEGTALVISHDRYFIEGYASEIWEVTALPGEQPPRYSVKAWVV